MNEQNGKNILERCDYLIINNLNFKQMKKKIFSIVAAVAVVAAAGWSYQQSKQYDGMSELALANVEALARYELPDFEVNCGADEGKCWKEDWRSPSGIYWSCKWSGSMQDICYDCPFL